MYHILMHWLNMVNGEKVVCDIDSKGNVWLGFKCSECGYVFGKYKLERSDYVNLRPVPNAKQ